MSQYSRPLQFGPETFGYPIVTVPFCLEIFQLYIIEAIKSYSYIAQLIFDFLNGFWSHEQIYKTDLSSCLLSKNHVAGVGEREARRQRSPPSTFSQGRFKWCLNGGTLNKDKGWMNKTGFSSIQIKFRDYKRYDNLVVLPFLHESLWFSTFSPFQRCRNLFLS